MQKAHERGKFKENSKVGENSREVFWRQLSALMHGKNSLQVGTKTLLTYVIIFTLSLQSWCSHHQWNKHICSVRDLGEQ